VLNEAAGWSATGAACQQVGMLRDDPAWRNLSVVLMSVDSSRQT
jgi:hypothetical protein